MTMINVSRQRRLLLTDPTVLDHLPLDLLDIIKANPSTRFLDAVALAALTPSLTDRVFVHFEHVFPDICARWILHANTDSQKLQAVSALARILPFSPYLAVFLHHSSSQSDSTLRPQRLILDIPKIDDVSSSEDGQVLLLSLITIWRLLSFDYRTFSSRVSPALMQNLFHHNNRAVRYIAIRVFCQLLHASDYKLESLIHTHLGDEAIIAEFDGSSVDFGFLSLLEHQRVKKVLRHRKQVERINQVQQEQNALLPLTLYTICYGDAVLPRPYGPIGDPSTLILTPTTRKNLECIASLLRNPAPIMLHGPTGIGKTTFIQEIAKDLGMYSSMVTLHLNEQTDAKMLIGLYSTDSKPGSFQWRPGVLTTAVREGRWVLVEDLDRAPTEVLSTLLPLIERNELVIPSRGETIKAANSFRLFATVRTSRGINGRENLPTLVGMRFWQTMRTQQLPEAELETVIAESYPMLRKFISGVLAVHNRLSRLSQTSLITSKGRSVMERRVSTRDLLKWCRRLVNCLQAAGSVTGEEPINESTRDWMFMEAIDCFVASCPDLEVSEQLVYAIAEEMHMSKERADHYITSNIPHLEESDAQYKIGRVTMRKQPMRSRISQSRQPFASTVHAKRLLEQVAVAVNLGEPVLLVGETGIGKTTVVQQLADSLGNQLIAVNLSQQSEVGDLLGGFKPVNVRSLAVPLKEDFEDLFTATGISPSKNQKYLDQLGKCFAKSQWTKVSKLWREAPKMFVKILTDLEKEQAQEKQTREDESQPTKKRRTYTKLQALKDLRPRWEQFANNLAQFDIQVSAGPGGFAFSFVEGNLVKAARHGHWVLLDEINLASPDTLESIADLLSGPTERPSLLLSETGEIEKIVAHPNFRIFGAMNPATDVGKRDLPIGIRSRFTEIYVRSPDNDVKDLLTIVKVYLGSSSTKNDQAADDIARLYLNTKRLADEKRIVDGANEVPHFSLRTLTRVLSYVKTIAPSYGVRRALYEGFSMGFLTLLERDSEKMLMPLIHHHLLDKHGNAQNLLSQPPKHPNDGKRYVKFQNQAKDRQYWLFQGDQYLIERDDYIITPYVERNLLNLVRATSTRRFPILIQGPTSAGKTSMIEYLANFTGNKFMRINNHEHTDLQEYLGTYVSGADGKLRFQEGILVQAMRQGHWIVLDELNLAPTDVLEALNRLLDDNRELLIPETQEIIKPHENFILFATQNPPGLYGGRKVLSRAFRNRFLELHFDDIPEDELEYILQQRSRNTSPPDCRRIISVYKELSRLRQTSRVFEQKDSFATLRDLFRWALREADTREDIAAQGYMLLAERVRDEEERIAVKEVIEKVFRVKIDSNELYSASQAPELQSLMAKDNAQGVVWTHSIRRLFVLVSRALRNNEPILLVGETGCGKTTVCQLLAEAINKKLYIVNAHQNTETGDLIGSQRPVRNRSAVIAVLNADLATALLAMELPIPDSVEEKLQIYKAAEANGKHGPVPDEILERIALNSVRSKALFEWSDGALVDSMRDGQHFLLDEISLADDSVLERLNSVLEPQRTLLLAEKGVDNSFIRASEGFQFFATMNPGGDFGKKELSPALRNRFTEIWVPQLSRDSDIIEILHTKLYDDAKPLADVIIQFANWFGATFRSMASTPFSIRELLAWVQFINTSPTQDSIVSLVHGAATVFIDSLGANPSALLASDLQAIHDQRQRCLDKLGELIKADTAAIYNAHPELKLADVTLNIGIFSVPRTHAKSGASNFALHAPTTRLNAMRVVRALQMQKPILLEGSPGVGKTTLVTALADICGRPLTRINLSDQTDLMDLFGTDVPVEGAEAGNFAWRDAPFLQAMQKGEWVLLDEMNLASQSVLEGLNACLDHRGEVYISELDQVFKRHPDFRLFAAQNPHHQGGGRKGLPTSFVNRFIVVYADVFQDEDLLLISTHNFPSLPTDTVQQLIQFVSSLDRQLAVNRSFGSQGAPWEFNLRDVLRWLHLLSSKDPILQTARVDDFLDVVIRQRFRHPSDRELVNDLFRNVFSFRPREHHLYHSLDTISSQIGLAFVDRKISSQPERLPHIDVVSRLPELESLLICVEQNIPCILTSHSGYGKSILIEYVAAMTGKPLVVFPMNADIDTMDLVGGFEQADPSREVNTAIGDLLTSIQESVMSVVPAALPIEVLQLLHELKCFKGDIHGISAIKATVETLLAQISPESEVGTRLESLATLLRKPLTLDNPRFEWLDGIIIKALQTGQWLLLDNANLCNASVLDRLNSLLEPSGFLSVNEHCGAGGEPRIVKPHPDFRIFLTVDPRYGELSRAMRNRAVEIYLCEAPVKVESCFNKITPVESNLQRFLQLTNVSDTFDTAPTQVPLDHFSLRDLPLLSRFNSQMLKDGNENVHALSSFVDFLQSRIGAANLARIRDLYSRLSPDMPPGFADSQPVHAMNNYTVSQLLPGTDEAQRSGAAFEASLELYKKQQALDAYKSRAGTLKLSELNRLERSLVSERVAAVTKDSTVGLTSFLNAVLTASYEFINCWNIDLWENQPLIVQFVLTFLDRTLSLSCSTQFDEATFQAHLSQGTHFFEKWFKETKTADTTRFLSQLLHRLNQDFTNGFKLTTGLSMEQIWAQFRPISIDCQPVLSLVVQLDRLGDRFDTLRWKANASLTDLLKAQGTLEQAYYIVRRGSELTGTLVHDLTKEIEALEAQIGNEAIEIKPLFAVEFEALRQIQMLQSSALSSESTMELSMLSNAPSRSRMALAVCSKSGALLQYVGSLADGDRYSWDGKLLTTMWKHLQALDSLRLDSLALLETELPILGMKTANMSAGIIEDPSLRLNGILQDLMIAFFHAHDEEFQPLAWQLIREVDSHVKNSPISVARISQTQVPGVELILKDMKPKHFRDIVSKHFIPAMICLASTRATKSGSATHSALAWLEFSIGFTKLYIPDRMIDPQLRPQMEREFHVDLGNILDAKVAALQDFEITFTGRRTNDRILTLLKQKSKLGSIPDKVQQVYRPDHSELRQVHAEFVNILTAFTDSDTLSMLTKYADGENFDHGGVSLLKENIERLFNRLSTRFEAYEDITRPAANLLRCFSIGVSLCDAASSKSLPLSTQALVDAVPFLGGSMKSVLCPTVLERNFEYLDIVSIKITIEGFTRLEDSSREGLFECFHTFYDTWHKRLDAEWKEEASRTSLYKFRGSFEDEEEHDAQEYTELFPTYDEEDFSSLPVKHKDEVRDASVKVARVHEKIFVSQPEPTAMLKNCLISMSQRVANDMSGLDFIDRGINSRLFAPALLQLLEKSNSLATTSPTKQYNFYNDPNHPEVRQLVVLTHKIKAKFRELQSVDEIGYMQPLVDVVLHCDKLFELVHADPLAKILPKVEQLHAHVYEWQFGGWASQKYSVLTLHNALTDTIIRWRRVELSTWANLFDMEEEKCKEDAASWWFIAYQIIIAVPLSMVDAVDELNDYREALIQNLEAYFSMSIVGQFRARVGLLRQLHVHLQHLSQDYPNLHIIHRALSNFISYFCRYQNLAETMIREGRSPIEKKMKDVLLMASWKDTNITALRESARKSHSKLFRLVRKFRNVLGQEMKTVIARGLPDEVLPPARSVDRNVALTLPDLVYRSLNDAVPEWLINNKRLANVTRTVSVMQRISGSEEMMNTVSKNVSDFVTSLQESMAELQKETPSFLTEHNSNEVKHLKTRKRKLFADTLRELRNMGLRHNLGQTILTQQESLARILASGASITPNDDLSVAEAEYYFHKILDLAPRVRDSARDHSEDLTGAEVFRSIGFIEGLLHSLRSQRNSLEKSLHSFSKLGEAVKSLNNISSLRNTGGLYRVTRTSNWLTVLSWLIQIIRFAVILVEAQGKLGSFDTLSVTTKLQEWVIYLKQLLSDYTAAPILPQSLMTDVHTKLESDFESSLSGLRAELIAICTSQPELRLIIEQVLVWTAVDATNFDVGARSARLEDLCSLVSLLCDSILVAVEKARKTARQLVELQEQPSWLQKHSDGRYLVLKQLHMDDIAKVLDQCYKVVSNLDLSQAQVGILATHVASIISPIVEEYTSLCRQSLDTVCDIHRSTAYLGFVVTRAYTQIASQGFCTPKEKSDETSNDAGKVESGTGLGDGEGAEDISKDIQPDEDLSELAQEANKEENGEMEDQKDAVDMADEDLEGEMGDVEASEEDDNGSKSGEEEGEDNELEEESGDVDDLDPTTVDEKMWDGDDEKAEKDQQGDKANGQKDDEQVAPDGDGQTDDAKEEADAKEDDETEDGASDAQDEDAQAQEELNKQDQTVEQNDTLALPDDLELDLDDAESTSSNSDDLDAMSDIEKDEPETQIPEEVDQTEDDEIVAPKDAIAEDDGDGEEESGPEGEEGGVPDEDDVQSDVQPEEDMDDPEKPEDQPKDSAAENPDNTTANAEDAAPSDVKSSGLDQNADTMDLDEQFKANAAEQQEGDNGEGTAKECTSAGNDGATSRSKQPVDKEQESTEPESTKTKNEPFKKLGDALEKWHRRQADITEAKMQDEKPEESFDKSRDQSYREFQHVQDDQTAPDTQAMGTADTEEIQSIDDAMAIDEEKTDSTSRLLDHINDEQDNVEADEAEVTEPQDGEDTANKGMEDGRSGVKTRQGKYDRDPSPPENGELKFEDDEDESLQDASAQLSTTHISEERPLRDYGQCMQEWSEFQTKSHSLSLSLTSQLRLILTPSQSTKLSGAFRTGKRLNIKRIIPYIASSYKRDKIWMRRAIPTKRTYQIMLCVDDSRSMGESSAGELAMESLVMVSRSLTMLEAGQVGILGFGSDVFTAHQLTDPFASDSGAKVLQKFSFSQDRTDIVQLIRQTIDTFRLARQQSSSGADLWQLALILSDGLTPSSAHDPMRRLLREAVEDRIMIVFIIMDDKGKKEGDSVLELKEAKFVNEGGESKVVIERYLDTFPFQYYLIVHNLEELPSALAGLLRTWFAEVNA